MDREDFIAAVCERAWGLVWWKLHWELCEACGAFVSEASPRCNCVEGRPRPVAEAG